MIKYFKRQHDFKSNSIFRYAEVDCSQSFQNICSLEEHMSRKHLQDKILLAEINSSVESHPSRSSSNTTIQHNNFESIDQPIQNAPIIAHQIDKEILKDSERPSTFIIDEFQKILDNEAAKCVS
ncbi:hypothetical protein PPYR_02408 [Photinus pyralis]|uniref:Uncharacterized protein n=1 Tax=Photinus pyralis TaxID=7054 RepID=A0A5N4B7A2_PHOPY|nr:hypothetical protein PPYR_02408 [Photinus pyralis]